MSLLKLTSGDDMEVSVVRFIDESEAETSEDLGERREMSDVFEREGEVRGISLYSEKYGWAKAWAAVRRFLGSKCNSF